MIVEFKFKVLRVDVVFYYFYFYFFHKAYVIYLSPYDVI